MTTNQDPHPALAPEPVPVAVQNGTFTIDHPVQGHFTLKVYTAQKGNLAGRRIVAMLVGPDNGTDYRGMAFWNEHEMRVDVWRRFASPDRGYPIDGFHWGDTWNATDKKLAIFADLAIRGATEERHGHWYSMGYRMLCEGRCVVCNRKLTDPMSITTGYGPECGGRR